MKVDNNERSSCVIGIIAVGIAILLVFLLTGCQALNKDTIETQKQLQDQTDAKGEVAVELHDTIPYGEMPPIDLSLPANLETATFGMG